MSALATIVGGLGELSESELQQLYLMVGVRLGIPGGAVPGPKAQGTKVAGIAGGRKKPGSKGSKASTASKGNPQRKSQWANHPLYIEYSRLKKVVEAQAKEAKTSFNAVDTAESRAYRTAFIQWMEAKSSFRDRRCDGQTQPTAEGEEGSDEESEEEAGPTARRPPAAPPAQAKPAPSGVQPKAGTLAGGAARGNAPATPAQRVKSN